jgi:hypothetical protein
LASEDCPAPPRRAHSFRIVIAVTADDIVARRKKSYRAARAAFLAQHAELNGMLPKALELRMRRPVLRQGA